MRPQRRSADAVLHVRRQERQSGAEPRDQPAVAGVPRIPEKFVLIRQECILIIGIN